MATKIQYEFDPFKELGLEPPERSADRKAALREAADFIHESILEKVGDTVSPVAGRGKFKRLDKEYAELKAQESSSAIANLELSGEMLDALKSTVKGNKIVTGITGSQAGKADGHNNFSGDSRLPERRFIPKSDDGETYKKDILNGVKAILLEHGATRGKK